MQRHILNRLYRSIPLPLACELHARLRSGCDSFETRQMVRQALAVSREIARHSNGKH